MLASLITIRPLNAATAQRFAVNLSSVGARALNGIGGVQWEPAITQPPALGQQFWNGDFEQGSDAGEINFTFNIAALLKSYPEAREAVWMGAAVEVMVGAIGAAWPWPSLFLGKVSGFTNKAWPSISVTATVDVEPFNANLLVKTYAGTGDAEGGADLKDQVKPLALGRPRNVEPVLINEIDSVYQFSGYGPIEAVEGLFERASAFPASIGDAPNYAALVAADIAPGRWATCLAEGLIRLGAPAAGVITGDIRGHAFGINGAPRAAGALVRAMASIAGVPESLLALQSLTKLDGEGATDTDIVVREQVTFLEASRRIILPCNRQVVISNRGVLIAMKPALTAQPQLTLHAQGRATPLVFDVSEGATSLPYAKTIMAAERAWRQQTYDEIASYAPLVDRGDYDASTVYREGNIVTMPGGSRWEFISQTPLAGVTPGTNDAVWALLEGDTTYPDGTPIGDLQPAQPGADVTGDNTSKDTDAVGGVPAAQVITALQQLDLDTAQALIDIAAAEATISEIQADADATREQFEGEISALEAVAAQIQADAATTKTALEADITSLQGTAAQIQVDAAATQSSLEASQATIAAQGASISQAQADIVAAGGRISTVEQTLGDQGASITSISQTVSNHTGRLATVESTVSTQGASISQNASAISTVQGDVASLSQTVSAQGASITQNATAISTTQGNLATLSGTVSSQGSSITALQSASSTQAGAIAQLTTRVTAGNPNILPNGGFENGLAGWTGANFSVAQNTGYGAYAYAGSAGTYVLFSDLFAINGGANYTIAADFYFSASGGQVFLDLQFYDAAGNLVGDGGEQPSPPRGGFTVDGSNRPVIAATWPAPASATQARARFAVSGATGSVSVGIRQIKVEIGSVATPYSNEASVVRSAAAITTANQQIATLSSTVGTQGASISANATAITGLSGRTASLETTVSAQGASITSNAQAIGTVNGNVASLSSTVSSQGAAISSLQTASSTLAGDLASLTTKVTAGNPNILPNGGFENGLLGWSSDNTYFAVAKLTGYGAYAYAGATGTYALVSDRFPISSGANYTIAADFYFQGSGGQVFLDLLFYDANGANILDGAQHASGPRNGFTTDGANRPVLAVTDTAPANATQARARFVVSGATGQVSVGVRQIKVEIGSSASPYSNEATIVQSAAAITSATQQIATLSSTVGTQGTSITQNASAITGLSGRTATLESTVSTQGASISSNAQAIDTVNGNLATLSGTVSSQGATISSLQSAYSGQAGSIATLTSDLSTANANISSNSTAISGINGSIAGINSTVSSQGSLISSNSSAISTLQSNLATLTQKVTAGNPNLLPNGSFENGLLGWNSDNSYFALSTGSAYGRYAYASAAGTYSLSSPAFPIDGATPYTIAADFYFSASGGQVFLDLIFLNASGTVVLDGPENPSGPRSGFMTDGSNRAVLKVTGTAPSTATQAVARFVVLGATGAVQVGVRQIKVELGNEATPYSNEAGVVQQFQALSTLNSQYASLSSTVSTQGVTITSQQSAISTLQGNVATAFARAAVKLDVNGYVTGWETNNNGSSGNFVINADNFQVVKPGGGPRLEYSGSALRLYAANGVAVIEMVV